MKINKELIWEQIFQLELKFTRAKIDIIRFKNLTAENPIQIVKKENNLTKSEEMILDEVWILTSAVLNGPYNPYIKRSLERHRKEILKLVDEKDLDDLLKIRAEICKLKKENNIINESILDIEQYSKKLKHYAWICSKYPDFKTENIKDAETLDAIEMDGFFNLYLE